MIKLKDILNEAPLGTYTAIGGFDKGASYKDSDNDGLPDDWEKKHGLNPADATDTISDLNGDGYTNIEDFINGLDPKAKKIDWADLKNNADARNDSLEENCPAGHSGRPDDLRRVNNPASSANAWPRSARC